MAEEQKTIKLTEEQLLNAFANERANVEAMQSNIAATENRLRDVLAATDALKAIKNSKEKEKIIVPLGAGIFIDASLESNSTAKNSMAGGVVVNVTIEDALKDLAEKRQEIEKAIAEMQKALERAVSNFNSIGTMLRSIEQKRKEQKKQA